MLAAKNIEKTMEATTAVKVAFLRQPLATVVVLIAIAAGALIKRCLQWLLPNYVLNLASMAVSGFLDGWYNHVRDGNKSCGVSSPQSRNLPYIDEEAELARVLQV